MSAIPISQWKWYGVPGHFIGASNCCFHMVTVIGDHMVSSVGCYHPRGDYFSAPEEIGSGRKFETFVFEFAGETGDGWPNFTGSELDSEGANTADEAQDAHMRMCRKVARGKVGWES